MQTTLTPETIALEIFRLKTLKHILPQYNRFNENIHALLSAQIRVLEENLSHNKIYDEYEPLDELDESDNLFDNRTEQTVEEALNAFNWRENPDNYDPPSKGWEELADILRLDPTEAQTLIEIPAPEWKGRCHEIANLLLKAGFEPMTGGTLHYGHYLGHVSPKSIFANSSVNQHGWVQIQKEGKPFIVDPTRWTFEATDPYIYVGPLDYYDDGGQELQKTRLKNPPKPTGEPIIEFPENPKAQKLLKDQGFNPGKLTFNQILHIGNLPPKCFEPEAIREVHLWLLKNHQGGLIPTDFRRITDVEKYL